MIWSERKVLLFVGLPGVECYVHAHGTHDYLSRQTHGSDMLLDFFIAKVRSTLKTRGVTPLVCKENRPHACKGFKTQSCSFSTSKKKIQRESC